MTIRVRAHVPTMAALAAGLIALWSTADAAPGYVTDGVNLRAGPGIDYPLLAPLPPGTPAEIFGCLDGWTWCDIAVNGPDGALRGWAAGPQLQLAYDGQPVDLPQYGPQLGLPVVGFDVDGYWSTYYRGEPWYGDRDRWRGDVRGYGPDRDGFAGGPPGIRSGVGVPVGAPPGVRSGVGVPIGARPPAGPPPGIYRPDATPRFHGGPPPPPRGERRPPPN